MRRLILLIGLLWAVPASAQVALVTGQVITVGISDDVTATLPSATSVGSIVMMAACIAEESATITPTSDLTESVEVGPLDSPGGTLRCYVWSAPGDGVTDAVQFVSSGTSAVSACMAEFTGLTGTLDDSDQADTANMAHDVDANIDTTLATGLLFTIIQSSGTADFAAGENMTQVSDDMPNGACFYRLLTAAGAYTTPLTSAANETSMIVSVGMQGTATGITGRQLLGGLGR